MKKALFICALLACSTKGLAVFDAEVLIGGASAQSDAIGVEEDKSGSASGSQVGISLHFDPFPTVPVSFGAIYLNQGFAVEQEKNKSSAFGGAVVGPEIMAWIPTVSSVSPYIKGAYALVGYGKKFDAVSEESNMGFQSEKKESTLYYSGIGTRVSAGLNWSPLRYLSFMTEYSMTWSKIRAVKLKDGASGETTELQDTASESLTTQGLLFGVGGNI